MRATSAILASLAAGSLAAAPAPKPAAKPGLPKAARQAPQKPLVRGRLGSRGGFQPPRPAVRPVAGPESRLPAVAAAGAGMVVTLRSSGPYGAPLDVKPDQVALDAGTPADAVASWAAARYPLHRSVSLAVQGEGQNAALAGELDQDAGGRPIRVGGGQAVLPVGGWLAGLKERIRAAVDAGAEGIRIEDVGLPAGGGYGAPFRGAWQDLFQSPWKEPHASRADFFHAARLRADLQLRALDELVRFAREYAKEKGRAVRITLAVPSPLALGEASRVFPTAAASRLALNGLVAQVDAETLLRPLPYEGRMEPDPFASAWLHSSYFANLMEGVAGRRLSLTVDPGDVSRGSALALAASALLFAQPKGFEVNAGTDASPGVPAAQDGVPEVLGALQEAADYPVVWSSGVTGVGVVVLDTAAWQRGGPSGSSMRSLYGLALPLLKRGIAAEFVPGERAVERVYLSRYRVLLLSYDAQKPLDADVSAGLAEWVKAGGVLIVFGGEDTYNEIGQWWTRDGYAGPTEHLLRQCGVAADIPQRAVLDTRPTFKEGLRAPAPAADDQAKVLNLPLARFETQGKAVFIRFADAYPADGQPARLRRVRVIDAGRVRADFTAGGVGERPFLVQNRGSQAQDGSRSAAGEESWVYRFQNLGRDTVLDLELGGDYLVSVGTAGPAGPVLQPGSAGLTPLRVPTGVPVVYYPQGAAEPLYRLAADPERRPGETLAAWASAAGKGHVLYCGLPAAFGADSPAGAELVRALTRLAFGKARLLYQEAPLIAQRGKYTVAFSQGRTWPLKGDYIDLLRPEAGIVTNPSLPLREPGLYRQFRPTTRIPTLLHATYRSRVLEANAARLRVILEGRQGATGTARIYPAGMSLAGIEAVDAQGRQVPVEARIEGRLLRVRYPQQPDGLQLTVRWIRPEARLTR